ncbi:GNAT family N-acetyltransferase [Pseudomonas sp. NPDC007930]|uniref:GNAT family N-acetyltransferase n=1 Tax=Pseudomonas sp. NPDC007930 TaxID=3364417 RepID=UPI0036E01423
MPLNWRCKHHSTLTIHELYALLQLRCEVFVVEQQCAYLDVDGQDLAADNHHLMAWQGEQLLAYARLLVPAEGEVAIGRVIIAAAGRGQGLGHQLMAHALAEATARWPGRPLFLAAQAHLTGYYGRYGFVAQGEAYLEDGIPHVDMRRG